MKKAFCVLATCILSLCCVLCAEAKTVGPLEHAPDSYDLAKKAKELGLDAIHDTVHEMARDEARHGKAFKGLLERYFK